MAMIDLTKPYIMVDNIITIKIDDVEKLQIKFKLYGCINVTDVSYTLNGTRYTLDSTDAYCNHLVPSGAEQTTFIVVASPFDLVILNAVVDQEWCESVEADKVGPAEFVDDPRTHFVRLRMDNPYQISNGEEDDKKHIKSDRMLVYDVTEFLPLALSFKNGEMTAADILDIAGIDDNGDDNKDDNDDNIAS